MRLAAAVVTMASLLAPRQAAEVEIKGYGGLDTECAHNALPLSTMGPHAPPWPGSIDSIMGHLMRYRGGEVLLEITREYPGVVADQAVIATTDELTGTAPGEIEPHRHGCQVHTGGDGRRRYHLAGCLSDDIAIPGFQGLRTQLVDATATAWPTS